jgi:hypothetical protein
MKRLVLAAALVLVAVLSASAIRYTLKAQERHRRDTEYKRRRRDAEYQAALRTFTQEFTSGLSRMDAESQLKAKSVAFTQRCCIDEQSAFADLIKIGEEDAPWYCSEQYVYIALEFAAKEPHPDFLPYDSDVLRTVRIYRQLGGCL